MLKSFRARNLGRAAPTAAGTRERAGARTRRIRWSSATNQQIGFAAFLLVAGEEEAQGEQLEQQLQLGIEQRVQLQLI
jgi:hypothetical protein